MNDIIADRLSDYLDGDLSPTERASIDAHLAGCAACRATLDELRRVVARARTLQDSAPDRDLWSGVAARIGSGPQARVSVFRRVVTSRLSFTLPQLAAASLALMVLSGGLVWLAKSGDPRADFQPVSAAPHRDGRAADSAGIADVHYDQAVAGLEKTFESKRTKLDPETVQVLDENLALIDQALDDCRRALDGDPSNAYVSAHLADVRQQKLAVLGRAATLPAN
jgi:anti-sigma factor RsiW